MNIFSKIIKKHNINCYILASYDDIHRETISLLIRHENGGLFDLLHNKYVYSKAIKYTKPFAEYANLGRNEITAYQAIEIVKPCLNAFLIDYKNYKEDTLNQL